MWDDALVESGDADVAAPRVLVAVITRRRDWEIVQRERWYRIPLARAPRRLCAEYLAFYHTASFPELRWSIHYYAPVERYDVARRLELLPDEPDHPRAQELYYRLGLGALQPLARPIPSHRLRRVAFINTSLARLLSAREINDLWEHSVRQDTLRQALLTRETAARRSYWARIPLMRCSAKERRVDE